jgi:pimeloyl-ACP methyl ester carboxylesterase
VRGARGARRITAGVALSTAAALAAAAPPAGALTFTRCAAGSPFRCARLAVPLDRSGAVPGTVNLFVERRPPTIGAARGAVLALAGGPGQAATPLASDFVTVLGPALRTRDLIVLDQRGTGKSGLLRCSGLERLDARADASPAEVAAAGEACANALGSARAHYTTIDSVEDVEAVRQALGEPRLTLYGTSYGVKVAEAYAKRYPAQVDGLILDSVVLPDAGDPLGRSTLAALPRVLGVLCAGGACARFGLDPLPDLRRLSARFDAAPGSGTAFDGRGRRRTMLLDASSLAQIAVSGDFDPVLRADTPAAVRAALNGDRAPLARALLRSAAVEAAKPAEQSDALFAATICEENQQLWDRSTAIPDRLAAARATLAGFPSSTFDPFGAAAQLKGGTGLCLRWPNALAAPALAPGPLPDVPALVLSGRDDLRTPLEDARTLVGQLPHSRLVAVAHVGHAVLFNDLSGCALRAVDAFFAARRPRDCSGARRPIDPTDLPPTRLSHVDPLVGLPGRRGRTVRAALLTLQDGELHAPDSGRTGGLRGGYIAATSRSLIMHDLVLVPGVRVSAVERGGPAHLSVAGPAASRAHLVVSRAGMVTGVVGGRRVRLVLARALAGGARGWLARGPRPAIRVP